MKNTLTATYHKLNFNSLSYDKFEELCFWLVEDLGEYKNVEYYGGTGDKNRDVIGYTYDSTLDYFQCKRYENPDFSLLKKELDDLLDHINAGKIIRPRRIYFVLSAPLSAVAKDKIKNYASKTGLPTPDFWEPVILDKKIKNNPGALKNFFGISFEKTEELLSQVDISGLISYGTDETRFTIINHGDTTAIECSWSLIGFAWLGYQIDTVFDLKPGQEKELRIAMLGNFMGKKPIKELRLHFKFRDSKNNWYCSERYLIPEVVNSGEFYRISAKPGQYIPTRPLQSFFTINSIDLMNHTGLNETRLITYTHDGSTKTLTINISSTLATIWQFDNNELEAAFLELSERKISKMVRTGNFEEKFYVNTYLYNTQKTSYEAYKELRDSLTR